MTVLLVPPVALMIYLALTGLLVLFGRVLAGTSTPNGDKSSAYSGGEASPTQMAAPGYRPFFVIALFFAVLHLGVLMLGSSEPSPIATLYLGGLLLTLIALILG